MQSADPESPSQCGQGNRAGLPGHFLTQLNAFCISPADGRSHEKKPLLPKCTSYPPVEKAWERVAASELEDKGLLPPLWNQFPDKNRAWGTLTGPGVLSPVNPMKWALLNALDQR